jgi:hypothetical protein
MKFKDQKSFFEHLGMADSERIHSEFISWLFSSECNVISEPEKINLLRTLFELTETEKIISVDTEISNIDIFIETNDSILIIENKIKSFQHSNQLERYKTYIESKYPSKKHRFIYLTLVNEHKVSNDWLHVSYEEILKKLENLNINKSDRQSAFLEDYILYIYKLLSCLNDVITNPKDFDFVFENGSLKKSDKKRLNFKSKKDEFISKNQLETIFQKAYLLKLVNDESLISLNGKINETRGNGLINFPIQNDILLGCRLYKTFIQIQGRTIKYAFCIQNDYNKSKIKWISNVVQIFDYFKDSEIAGFKRKNNKKLAYVSISKRIDVPYWRMSIDEFATMVQKEIKIGENFTLELMNKIKN